MSRTNGVSLSFIRDCICDMLVKHPAIGTNSMCTDIFTKFSSAKKSKVTWVRVLRDVNIMECKVVNGELTGPWRNAVGGPGPGHASAVAFMAKDGFPRKFRNKTEQERLLLRRSQLVLLLLNGFQPLVCRGKAEVCSMATMSPSQPMIPIPSIVSNRRP